MKSNKHNFTERWIERLSHPEVGSKDYTDKKSPLTLRVSKNCKTYSVRITDINEGRKRRISIAEFGEIPLKQARQKAFKIKWQAKKGKIPGKEKDKRKDITFRELAIEHMEVRQQNVSPEMYRNDLRRLELHIFRIIGHKKMTSLQPKDIPHLREAIENGTTARKVIEHYKRQDKRAEEIAEKRGVEYKPPYRAHPKGGHEVARCCVSLVSVICQYALIEGIIERNPVRDITSPKRNKGRVGYLSQSEKAILGPVLIEVTKGNGQYNQMAGYILLLLILTGCRYAEIASLKWEAIDFDEQCINFKKSKNGAKRTFIGKIVVKILQEIRQNNNPQGNKEYVFPSSKKGKYYVGTQNVWQRMRESLNMKGRRIHDFRHAFASTAASLGKVPKIVSSLLGHSNRTVTDIYTHCTKEDIVKAADEISAITYKQLCFQDEKARGEATAQQMELPF